MKTIGILGGGQLGMMLAMAGIPLGYEFIVIDPAEQAPASKVARHIRANYSDKDALTELSRLCDIITYEFENIPNEAIHFLTQYISVYPPVVALEVSQDRIYEKNFFRRLNIPVPAHAAVRTEADAYEAVAITGLPAILKQTRFGYDGKGQREIQCVDELVSSFKEYGEARLILEEKILFERELSQVSVRAANGEIRHYPLVENKHRNGILLSTMAPAERISGVMAQQAQYYTASMLQELNYIGVICLELFDLKGKLLANEFAPRVHNTGHWTIEGAVTSQFENHIRAISGLPLGNTQNRGYSFMVNLIGNKPDIRELAAMESAHIHLYGKEPRPGRKIGHITFHSDEQNNIMQKYQKYLGRFQ
jgi:5-(carboxyamino)imidazole ribonucleotide synthase